MKMEYWKYLCVLLLAIFVNGTGAQNCSINEALKNSTCICDFLDYDIKGWEYTCFDYSFQTLYKVQYAVEHWVTFQCGEDEPDYHSILQQLHLGDIQTFAFKSCPLPNVSYSEIIPYQDLYPIEQLKIENRKGNSLFTAEIFGNISETLISIILTHNKIDMLPESLFYNFTHLKYLSLSDNKLSTLPQNIFLNAQNLITLEVTNNLLEALPENIFLNLQELEKLYLYKNKLRELPTGIFKSLANLKILDLADNNLMLLQDGVFQGLSSLTHVRLRANWLMTVSSGIFNDSINLKEINLSLNKFMEPLPEKLLFGLTQLENISMAHCNLTQIQENFFSYSPSLTNLNLQKNSLSLLPPNIFLSNPALADININSNLLNSLPQKLFPNQMNLIKLSLSENNLSTIPNELFERARKIKTLILAKNQLLNFSQTLFQDLPNLEYLDLKSNNLTYFQLDSNENIKDIDLSENYLTEMPSLQWTRYLRLEKLNLERNKISYLSIPVLYPTNKRNPALNFAHNSIKTVNVSDVSFHDKIVKNFSPQDYDKYGVTIINLNSNPLMCDCKIYSFYKYVKQTSSEQRLVRFDGAEKLACQEPRNLAGQKIMSLSSSQFTCELQEKCPSPCHCYARAEDSANIVNCSYQKLSTLPAVIPPNINVLLFQGNNLTSMKEFDSKWENLTELFLDKNKIASLNHWKLPTNLKNISLSGNRIRTFSPSVMDFISNAQDFKISLGNNPWTCNCSTRKFKKWLTDHYGVVEDMQDIICANRIKENGTLNRSSLISTSDEVLCPIDDWPYKLRLISVTAICVVLALLLLVVSVLYYRNKQTVIAYVYIHMHHVFTCFFSEEDMDEDKIFDAFISYSSSDHDVARKLIEELEGKEPRFQLCIHERNWIAGNPISWNIFNSVHHSKRTILVLSKEFLESIWFQVEFHTAYYQMLEDKIDRLIIIVKGELPAKEMLDKDLQYLLSTKTYLVWDEKWFWEKLRYALPHRKKQIVPNDVLALKDRPANEKIKQVENQIAILSSGAHKTPGKVPEVSQILTNTTGNVVKKDILSNM